jgi:hypothetical protein
VALRDTGSMVSSSSENESRAAGTRRINQNSKGSAHRREH